MSLPDSVKRLFWGDDLSQVNWPEYETYITQTILEKGDYEDVIWLLHQKSKNELRQSLSLFKLSPRSKAFWSIYLS